MTGIFILTMAIMYGNSATTFTQEYGSQAACNNAAAENREKLSHGIIILLTCTKKS